MKRYVIVAALIVACTALSIAAEPQETFSETDQLSLRKVAQELREAILDQDIEKVLRHISKNGLGCTDSQIPRSLVKKHLYDKNSHLYMSLFDSAKFSNRCGSHYPPEFPAISDKEFFLGAREGLIEIDQLRWGLAQVIFKSPIKGHYQREWTFQKEGNDWKLVYGFIVGNCSCG